MCLFIVNCLSSLFSSFCCEQDHLVNLILFAYKFFLFFLYLGLGGFGLFRHKEIWRLGYGCQTIRRGDEC